MKVLGHLITIIKDIQQMIVLAENKKLHYPQQPLLGVAAIFDNLLEATKDKQGNQ